MTHRLDSSSLGLKAQRVFAAAQARGVQFDSIGRSTARPKYTVAEVGMALGGLRCGFIRNKKGDPCIADAPCHPCQRERERSYAAFAWIEGAHINERGVLYRHLTCEVYLGYDDNPDELPTTQHVPMAQYEGWPRLIANQEYKDKLIKLAIDEDRMTRHVEEPHPLSIEHPFFFHQLAARGLTDITELLWRRRLERKYIAIRHVILTWHATANFHADEKFRGGDAA